MTEANSAKDDGLSAWERGDSIPWERELITLFARNQIRVFAAMPILAAIFAAVSLLWMPWWQSLCWLVAAIGAQVIQFNLCQRFLKTDKSAIRFSEWIGMLASSEFLIAACWSLPLFVFWDGATNLQRLYVVASIMAVSAVRLLIAANFMPVVIAGTGFITFNITVRCILEADPLYVALGAMVIAVEIFFIQLAVRLQQTARDMLIFKSQKEQLIEELKRQKEAAEAAQKNAEEASRAKSSFLATMSHELRTPLNAIMGYSEIMSHEMFGRHQVEAYKNYAHDIHSSGHYLLNLINDVLDLSRIEAGKVDLQEEPVSVLTSAEEAFRVVELRAKQKSLQMAIDLAPGLPKIMADRRALQQIWLNLLSNAIKFTPGEGRITLKAWRRDDGCLAIAVSDSGPGIPAGELALALNAFTRGSYATNSAIDGVGLGLAIVKGLLAQHEGTLDIRSEEGRGTEAIAVFPASRVLDGPRGEVLSAPTVKSSSQRKLIAVTG